MYTIKQVSQMLNLPASTIRYYDKQGMLPFVKRKESGYRDFDDNDIAMLRIIECLKMTGMPIKDIKQFTKWVQMGDSSLQQRRDMFAERKQAVLEQMQTLQQTLEVIEYKYWYYQTALEAGTEQVHHTGQVYREKPSCLK